MGLNLWFLFSSPSSVLPPSTPVALLIAPYYITHFTSLFPHCLNFFFFFSCHQSAVITILPNGASFSSIPSSDLARFPGGERQWLLCVWNTLQHDALRQRVVLRQDPQQGFSQIPGQEVQQDRAVHCVSVREPRYNSFILWDVLQVHVLRATLPKTNSHNVL